MTRRTIEFVVGTSSAEWARGFTFGRWRVNARLAHNPNTGQPIKVPYWVRRQFGGVKPRKRKKSMRGYFDRYGDRP